MKTSTANLVTNNDLPYGPFKSVHVGSRTHLLPADIMYISADINYSMIHLTNGRSILVSTTLGKIEKRLFEFKNLVRVHKSFVVNTAYLQKIYSYQVELKNGVFCKVSRRKMKNLLEQSSNS